MELKPLKLTYHPTFVMLSPDKRYFYYGGHNLFVYDTEQKAVIQKIPKMRDSRIGVSPDGRLVVTLTSSTHGTHWVWHVFDMENGLLTERLRGNVRGQRVDEPVFISEDNALAVFVMDLKVLWQLDCRTGEMRKLLECDDNHVFHSLKERNGKLLIGMEAISGVRVPRSFWVLSFDGKNQKQFPANKPLDLYPEYKYCWLTENKIALLCKEYPDGCPPWYTSITILNLETGAEEVLYQETEPTQCGIDSIDSSPDGKLLVISFHYYHETLEIVTQVLVYDLQKREIVFQKDFVHMFRLAPMARDAVFNIPCVEGAWLLEMPAPENKKVE